MIANTFWSDNWWIEENNAWFIDGGRNMLISLNLKTKQYEFLKEIPDDSPNKFRLNPRCMKCEDVIFCFPDLGQYIWVYSLEHSEFIKIEVENPDKSRLSFSNFWKVGGRIFAVSIGLRQILEIDIKKRKIIDYNSLTDSNDEQLASSVKVGAKIYCVSAASNKIYEFDLETKKSTIYEISDIKGKLHTICFDGDNFLLCGYYKELYVWSKENNTIKIIDGFPEDFGIYNFNFNNKYLLDCEIVEYNTPTFLSSIVVHGLIWFIPFQTNKIIYLDKISYQVYTLEIEEENENEESLRNRSLNHKYLLEYVREGRYIGLYSFKNKHIIEIDALKRKVVHEEYILSHRCLLDIAYLYEKYERKFNEKIDIDRKVYGAKLFDYGEKRENTIVGNIGTGIYKELTEEF